MKLEIKGLLDKVTYARNNSLHRSPEEKESLADIKPLFKAAIKKGRFEKTENDKKIIKEYYYLKFLEGRDYNIVTFSIVELRNIIVSNLNKVYTNND